MLYRASLSAFATVAVFVVSFLVGFTRKAGRYEHFFRELVARERSFPVDGTLNVLLYFSYIYSRCLGLSRPLRKPGTFAEPPPITIAVLINVAEKDGEVIRQSVCAHYRWFSIIQFPCLR